MFVPIIYSFMFNHSIIFVLNQVYHIVLNIKKTISKLKKTQKISIMKQSRSTDDIGDAT